MNSLNIQNFPRLFLNDVLSNASKLIRPTISIMILAAIYTGITAFGSGGRSVNIDPFQLVLFFSGAVFTASIFKDLHAPLEGLHFLMLPAPTVSKVLVRYLISGPLFALYVILAFMLFEFLSSFLLHWLIGQQVNLKPWSTPETWPAVLTYLQFHVYVFFGAVIFEKSNLARTIISAFGFMFSLIFVCLLVYKLRYPEYFSNTFSFVRTPGVDVNITGTIRKGGKEVVEAAEFFLTYCLPCWVLYLSYLWVKDHEV